MKMVWKHEIEKEIPKPIVMNRKNTVNKRWKLLETRIVYCELGI